MKTEYYNFFDLFTSQEVRFKKSKVKVIEVLQEDFNNFYVFILDDESKIKVSTEEYDNYKNFKVNP